MEELLKIAYEYGRKYEISGGHENYFFEELLADNAQALQLQQAGVSSRFSNSDMISLGNFIRDNYYGVGAPKLISYNTSKYPHGTIEEIFVIWSCENGY